MLVVFAAAIAAAGVAVAQQTADPAEVQFQRGKMARRSGNLPAAARSFRAAVELAPDRADAWFQLGLVSSGMQDWPAAIEAYGRAAELDPANAKAANNLANVYFRRGHHEEAAHWYARALAIDPGYLNAAFHNGWVLRELGRESEAEASFARCLEIPATDPRDRKTKLDCLFYSGALRFRARDYARAAEVMEQVISVNPDHVEAYYYLGMAYRQLGRDEEALQVLERHDRMTQVIRARDPVERQARR